MKKMFLIKSTVQIAAGVSFLSYFHKTVATQLSSFFKQLILYLAFYINDNFYSTVFDENLLPWKKHEQNLSALNNALF